MCIERGKRAHSSWIENPSEESSYDSIIGQNLQDVQPQISSLTLGLGAALAAVISLACLRVGLLTRSGALAAFGVGAAVFGAGGWAAIPLLIFFVTSVAWGRWRKRRNKVVLLEKDGARDAIQVLANGALAAFMVLFAAIVPKYSAILHLLFASAIAAACADTWATEIGSATSSTPRLITTLKKVEPGRSGAVSFGGLSGALAGAAVIALTSLPLLAPPHRAVAMEVIIASGLAGTLVDSFLGATLQERIAARGLTIGNDLVNFLACAAACVVAALLWSLAR